MNPTDIIAHIRRLFDPTTSPGQAFDVLFALRQSRVTYQEVLNALNQIKGRLDETEPDEAEPDEAMPGEEAAQSELEVMPRPTAGPRVASAFRNPRVDFGKYRGKTLLEIVVLNPGYVVWLSRDCVQPQMKEQARLALIESERTAPISRDVGPTNYMD